MTEYKIEGGNSSVGEIGFVGYVHADSPEEALDKFKDAVGHDGQDVRAFSSKYDADLLVRVYFNPGKLTVTKHVESVPDGDDDSGLPR